MFKVNNIVDVHLCVHMLTNTCSRRTWKDCEQVGNKIIETKMHKAIDNFFFFFCCQLFPYSFFFFLFLTFFFFFSFNRPLNNLLRSSMCIALKEIKFSASNCLLSSPHLWTIVKTKLNICYKNRSNRAIRFKNQIT